MITDYKIIEVFSVENLTTIVNNHIKEGWKPIGGVSTTRDNRYIQAIAKCDCNIPAIKIETIEK